MINPTLTLPFVRGGDRLISLSLWERVRVWAIRCRRGRPIDQLSPSPIPFPRDREGVTRGSSLNYGRHGEMERPGRKR